MAPATAAGQGEVATFGMMVLRGYWLLGVCDSANISVDVWRPRRDVP